MVSRILTILLRVWCFLWKDIVCILNIKNVTWSQGYLIFLFFLKSGWIKIMWFWWWRRSLSKLLCSKLDDTPPPRYPPYSQKPCLYGCMASFSLKLSSLTICPHPTDILLSILRLCYELGSDGVNPSLEKQSQVYSEFEARSVYRESSRALYRKQKQK